MHGILFVHIRRFLACWSRVDWSFVDLTHISSGKATEIESYVSNRRLLLAGRALFLLNRLIDPWGKISISLSYQIIGMRNYPSSFQYPMSLVIVDGRESRGVRSKAYSWVNRRSLMDLALEAGAEHVIPTTSSRPLPSNARCIRPLFHDNGTRKGCLMSNECECSIPGHETDQWARNPCCETTEDSSQDKVIIGFTSCKRRDSN